MVSILDIGPAQRNVTVQDQEVPVRGVGAAGIFHLLDAFPELRKVWTGATLDISEIQSLLSKVPLALENVIAAGLGHPGEAPYIKWASERTVGEQFEFLTAIVELTFPKGLADFMESVTKQMAGFSDVSGKVQAMRSPAQSKPVSAPATTSTTAGATPPDSSKAGQSSSSVTEQVTTLG